MDNLKNIILTKIGLKKTIVYILCSILVLSFIFLSGRFLALLRPVSQISDTKQIEINTGEGFIQISDKLKRVGVIRSNVAFRILSLLSGSAHKLKPGIYSLDTSQPSPQILRNLITGSLVVKKVIIQEGLTLLDIDKKLSKEGVLPLNALAKFDFKKFNDDYEFLQNLESLEGYLFPDTYNFFANSKPEEVVKKFLDNFNQKAWPILKDISLIIEDDTYEANQFINIASLIEKEIYFDEERSMVSGIIYNRLRIGMPLQIDATVSYAKCKGFFFYCDNPVILKKETELSSPFNTYLFQGLPPTPISNPGLSSIKAVLNPEKSDYLYYLSDPKTKKTIYSKTLDEHNTNKAKYIGY
ncbi:endolytic transglycosylase MltG [Patescibacteria group bacterium]|nr:endolytic transglycosylase MltG [Patescibacteria group bacterium]